MQPTSPTDERGDTVQRARWSYTTVNWDYPPPPAAYYDALLARGASHSRFLRIAYLTTRERSSPISRPCPPSPSLHRRKTHWPKPPHYHASLLRSPLSRRKGLFRAVLAPSKAVDFVRWDIFADPGSPSNLTSRACTVAECVLEPYEAAAGFSGWHGLGVDVTRRVQGNDECPRSGVVERQSDLRREIDEATVDEGRARWASLAQDLVGPPGIALRWFRDKGTSTHARQEVRWDPDIGSSPFRPPRPMPAPDDKRRLAPSSSATSISGSKPQLKVDSPSAWWCAPSSHRGPPHSYPLRFPHTPHGQCGPPPLQFPPYFPGRLPSVQAHGDWFSVQPTGAPSVNHPVKSHSHSHASPTHVHPSKCPPRSLNASLGQDEYEPGRDGDKETETDHDYESTTTTTDSDPPPHTPIGAVTTSHCVDAPLLHGDDDETEHGSAALKIPLSDPTTPVKLLPRFAMSPSVSSSSPDLIRAGHESSKAAVVFPSLNGSFRQGSLSRMPAFSSNRGASAPTTPARVAKTASLSSKVASPPTSGDEKGGASESPASSSRDKPAFKLSPSSPPHTSPGSALRKDSQGFWEPVAPISPCSSLSSLPLSPSEGKMRARPTTGRPVELPEVNGLTKCRSLSPGPRREASVDSSLSSSSRPTAFSSPTSTPASASVFGSSYPCSPANGSLLFPPNPTTLLPAFLTTTGEKRKKASRTREIVDQLRTSSVDVDKGVEGLGWVAAGGELDGVADKASDQSVENHVAGPLSPSSPSQSRSNLTPRSGSDSGKHHSQASRGSGGKCNGVKTGSETCSPTATRTGATAAPSTTPFPILSVSQAPNVTMVHRNQITASSNAGDASKTNATVTKSPNARSQLSPDTPPSAHHAHHPLPSPTHPTVHVQQVLAPPMVAVAAYPPPMYVPCTQYSLVPPHQQPGQGGWVAMYPAHIPAHPIPAQVHITGVSGMRHVSW